MFLRGRGPAPMGPAGQSGPENLAAGLGVSFWNNRPEGFSRPCSEAGLLFQEQRGCPQVLRQEVQA